VHGAPNYGFHIEVNLSTDLNPDGRGPAIVYDSVLIVGICRLNCHQARDKVGQCVCCCCCADEVEGRTVGTDRVRALATGETRRRDLHLPVSTTAPR